MLFRSPPMPCTEAEAEAEVGAQEARREAKVSARPGESVRGWGMDTQRSRRAVQCERLRSKSLLSGSSSSSVGGERDGQSM